MKLLLCIACISMVWWSQAQAPTADFSATPLSVCIGDPIDFTDLSTVGASAITNWGWDFGDGNASTTTNPSHVYGAPGNYTVTLVVTAANGQADAEVKVGYVTVNDLPNVGFTVSGNGCTVPFDVTFTNTSDMGGNYTYDWDFGNTQTSQLTSPAPITYNAAGAYSVVLNVTNTTTGCLNSISQDIVVSDYSAGLTGPITGCVGEAIDFLDASTVGTDTWNWTDGNGNSSSTQNPSFTYATPGNYTVTLNASNSASSCADVITQNITINPLPTPSFTADVTTGCAPLGVTFTNTSGPGTNFDWDFGNGTTFNGASPLIQNYLADGSYSVTLTMTDANGCTATETITNIVTVSAPTVNFSMDEFEGCAPLTVQFTESSTSPDPVGDPIVTWLWDFGDGSGAFSGQTPPPHDYAVGVYTVSLTVITQNGCQANLTLPDTIQVGSIDQVNFSVSPIIDCAKNEFDFIDLTTFNGVPDPGEVIYAWDFGDSGLSADQSPTYEYPLDTGYFDVTLTVDWRGCEQTFTMPQAVYVQAPISIFTPDDMLFCNPGSFPVTLDITDMAILGVDSDNVEMVWKWGDGSTTQLDDSDLNGANQGSSSHDYNAYGSYTIEQVVYNYTTGCEDSTQQTIHISQTVADFTLSNDSTCVGSPIDLTSTSTSTHPLVSYSYDMGNGGLASGTPTTFTYNNPGTFDITLTANNNVGCSDTEIFTGMTALSLPVAIIDPSATAGCSPITVNYTDISVVNGNGTPISTIDWMLPDASTQTTGAGGATSYMYPSVGNFTVTMIATDEFGCVSAPANVNMITTKPTADFVVDTIVCDLEVFTAVNQSTGGSSYNWFIDNVAAGVTFDLTTAFDEVTSATTDHVDRNIVLIVTDPNGCTDTTDRNVVVSMPRADIDFGLSGASTNANGEFTCPPVFSAFEDFSDSYGSITNWDWDFGDGKFSALQDPSNTYVFSGTYSASLTITDEYGCTHDTTLVDFVTILGPSGDVSWSGSGDVCGQTFLFDAQNLSNVDNIIWDLGDGTIINSTMGFPHTYTSYDTFDPSAILVDDIGCEVPIELPQIVVAGNGPQAEFTSSVFEGPIGTVFVFDESSTAGTTPIVAWTWGLGNDTLFNTTDADVIQDFGLPGTYSVTLLVTDVNGCIDKESLEVTITDDFHLPNVFTPNADGTNDVFTLPANIFTSFDIVILNRWGNVIHERSGATGTLLWDGKTQSGNDVNDGVYFYRLIGTIVNGEQAEKHGNVSVFHKK